MGERGRALADQFLNLAEGDPARQPREGQMGWTGQGGLRQPLVKGKRLVCYEVNVVIPLHGMAHDVLHDGDATQSWLSGAL